MKEQKFKGYSKESGLSTAETLKHWMCYGEDLLFKYDTFIQYLGYADANKVEVYEGDVLELKITEDLTNHNKNTFFNSNLGKTIEKEKNITSVLLLNVQDKTCMAMNYEVYFCRDGKIDRYDDSELKVLCYGDDRLFPQYLCNKGAVVIGNILVDKDILNRL